MAISYIGLLCHGKNDFEHIEQFRYDDFFKYAMNIDRVPSCSMLRQRFDTVQDRWNETIKQESASLFKNFNVKLTPCFNDHIPLDIDVSPFDNSNTKKEGVSRTYKGVDGYAPIFSYLGQEGYCINTELREGKSHSQCETTEDFLKSTIEYAKMITDKPLLVRMDSGNDSIDNINIFQDDNYRADFIIKRNLRREKPSAWLIIAKEKGRKLKSREGKNIYVVSINKTDKKLKEQVRIVIIATEKLTRPDGKILLIPEIEVDSYYTSLTDVDEETIARLYREHRTSEQFHSELKTDLDLERLPSGKFKTNELILHLGIFAYNLLRIIGQESLNYNDTPSRKKIFRRRIKTVIQGLITLASKMVNHARKIYLRFGRISPWFQSFKRIYCWSMA